MLTNHMYSYAAKGPELTHRNPRNLFALRCDIHALQFDTGNFVIVPINGNMMIHFISQTRESAALYHNKHFDSNNLSNEFFFARFAWAVIKNAHAHFISRSARDRKAFNLKAATPLDEEEEMGLDSGDGESGATRGKKRKGTKGKSTKGKSTKRKRPDGPAARDARELDKDITTAKKVAPFFRMSLKPFLPSYYLIFSSS